MNESSVTMQTKKVFTGPDKIDLTIYDVGGNRHGKDIDFNTLDVIRTAPAWLSSAERLMLFTLIYSLRPQRYLEIGILYGGASLIVAKAMDAVNSDGKLILVDINPQVEPSTWQGMEHRSICITGYSPKILRQAFESAKGKFDFVFIDAGHSSNAVTRDAEGVFPFLEDGAYILFHDSYREPVNNAINKFIRHHFTSIIDFGLITREYEYERDGRSENSETESPFCGFRLVQYRKHHGLIKARSVVTGLGSGFFNKCISVLRRFKRLSR
jgi:cephalosporin hydroxylase